MNTRANGKALVELTDSQSAELGAFCQSMVDETKHSKKPPSIVSMVELIKRMISLGDRVSEINSMRRAVSDLKSRPVCRCGDRAVMVIDIEKQRPDPKVIADLLAEMNQSLAESE